MIEGATAVAVQDGYTNVVNDATIESDTVKSCYTTSVGTSVVLQAGGKVSQTTTSAEITNGIAISGGGGTVINRGTIGGSTSDYSSVQLL